MTTVIFHLLPPYLSQAPDIPLSSQQETICLMVPDHTYPLMAGPEEFSLLVTRGKREQHECREGRYQKVKVPCDGDTKGPRVLTLLVPSLVLMYFIVALLGEGPGFFVSAGHTPCCPKAASWRSLACPNSPGGDLKEIDVSVWELDHKVL